MSSSCRGPPLAGQIDALGVANDAVDDGVGERGNADQVIPAVHGNLTGDDERGLVVTVLDDFEQIARLIGVRASGPQSSRMSRLARARERRPGRYYAPHRYLKCRKLTNR